MWCHRCAKGVQKWVAGAWRHGGFIPNWWPSDWGKWWSSIKYGDAGHCWEPNHPPNLSQFQFAGKSFHHALGLQNRGKDSTTILFSWRSPSHHQSNNVENAIINRPFEMVSPLKIVILGDGVSHSWHFEVTNPGDKPPHWHPSGRKSWARGPAALSHQAEQGLPRNLNKAAACYPQLVGMAQRGPQIWWFYLIIQVGEQNPNRNMVTIWPLGTGSSFLAPPAGQPITTYTRFRAPCQRGEKYSIQGVAFR